MSRGVLTPGRDAVVAQAHLLRLRHGRSFGNKATRREIRDITRIVAAIRLTVLGCSSFVVVVHYSSDSEALNARCDGNKKNKKT